MASHLLSRQSSTETTRRRNMVRKVLLESLERRDMMAADLLSSENEGYVSSLTRSVLSEAKLTFSSLNPDLSGYDITSVLDSTLGGAGGSLTERPWFGLIEKSYSDWSQQNGLAFSYTSGLHAEGELGELIAEGEAGGPKLLSVAPNSSQIFSFNGLNQLKESPTELVLRFDSPINMSNLNGIQLWAAGQDDAFNGTGDRQIVPGWIGAGDTNQIVVMRFASTLPDDLYRIQLTSVGTDAVRGTTGLSLENRTFDSTPTNLTVDSIDFDVELGTRVAAVVPQPITRNATTGALTQDRRSIEVYFDSADKLSPTTATNLLFYQLYQDRNTVSNVDDVLVNPSTVVYDAANNKATLTFSFDLDDSANGTSYRLRVGTSEANLPAPTVTALGDAGDTFASANNNLGVFDGPRSNVFSGTNVRIANSTAFPLDFPGAPDTPGKRQIVDDPDPANESHLLDDTPDSNVGVTVQFYNFNKTASLGVDAFGNPQVNSISPEQEQRAREVFEFYSRYTGIQFVETDNQGWTIATSTVDGVGGAIGVANGVSAIMDAAESWWDALGDSDNPSQISWFQVAMHEIGHLLGLGHNSDQPPGTNMSGAVGGETSWILPGVDVEPVFPGAGDLVGAKYINRPDSRDIDLYRFEIPANQSGVFTAEIMAERLANSSLLDSLLTLYRQNPNGTREVVAVNDGYFSNDSYLKLNLQGGIYFLGVSASGNKNYNPEVADSGLGGTSEGLYELRTTFVPLATTGITDVDGSALDGDADGVTGGAFNFWFQAGTPVGSPLPSGGRRALIVDKQTGSAAGNGSLATPFLTIQQAFAAAQVGDIVRIVGNGGTDRNVSTLADNFAYEIGRGGVGNQPLSDGQTMNVPAGVTVMIDAGAVFKMRSSSIGVGSSSSTTNRSGSHLQILGTPGSQVVFTSYDDESTGVDTNPIPTSPAPGQWGGVIFQNAVDRSQGRFDSEINGRFVNYVSNAKMSYGGGRVTIDGQETVIAPIHLNNARPTVINNTIEKSASAAISANPNSFEVTNFTTPRFQSEQAFTPAYDRVGPDVQGNKLSDNSVNGMFIRIETVPGQPTAEQTVTARWKNREITHVVSDVLTISGTPGGPILEDTSVSIMPPNLSGIGIANGGTITGGQLTVGPAYRYRMTFVDSNGLEGVTSLATSPFVLSAGNNSIRLTNLPTANRDFVARRLYRSTDGVNYFLVAELDKSSGTHVDSAAPKNTRLSLATQVSRGRLDASLFVDPGMVVKLNSGRITAAVSSQFVAEGTSNLPIVFTSRSDDRYGAAGTFDTNNDSTRPNPATPAPGDWGGLYFGHLGSGSLDHTLITFGGGSTAAGGGFAGFNAVEVHQADVRIANSTLENNSNGGGTLATIRNRNGLGFNENATIFARGSQPIIVDNIIRNNTGAAISIDAQSMSGNSGVDFGRSTGFADRRASVLDNKGPLVRGNALGSNATNGMIIRGGTLTTESVWDDADIVHVVLDPIQVPDFFVFGGLRLQSSADSNLVVKFGPGASLTSIGRPLEIDDRIGGTINVIGNPGFPVILTSLSDDTAGAGFDPTGVWQKDTNNNGASQGTPGQWVGVRIAEFSNDRNVVTSTEREPGNSTGVGVNGIPDNAQFLGRLAKNEKSSDDNLRLGFTVTGTINTPADVDVYSFDGSAGTQVWFDIDRTDIALDSVIELVDEFGVVIAGSNDSLAESAGVPLTASGIDARNVNPLPASLYSPRNGGNGLGNSFADFYSTNTRDAGMRVVLPGSAGTSNKYFIRVRSQGNTVGQYQLQVRLREKDEIGGSSVNYADIRFAQNGISVFGMPTHSPLVGEASELATNNDDFRQALNLGNLLNVDRAELSVAGDLSGATDVDWYRFDIDQQSIQSDGLRQHISTILDVDYADGLGRANTSLWLFYDDQNLGTSPGVRLVSFGTDSNIADDQASPTRGSNLTDLSRGSAGFLDAFIGNIALPSGTYYLAISSNAQISSYLSQFTSPNPGQFLNVRVEPVNSVQRVVEDRFGGGPGTALAPLQTAIDVTGGGATPNAVPYSLADVVLFVSQASPGADNTDLIAINPFTGEQISLVSRFNFVEDIAMRGDGTIHGSRAQQTGIRNDANGGGILTVDAAGNGATTAVTGTSGIQTFELDTSVAPPAVAQAFTPGTTGRAGRGMEFYGLTYPQVGSSQFLYAAGSRVGTTTFRSFAGNVDAQNFIYKLTADTLTATSAPQADRIDNARLNGAGTQIVERGYVDTSRDAGAVRNVTSQTVVMADASPSNAPALLDGDRITLRDSTGTLRTFEWDATVLSATLVANTQPQAVLTGAAAIPVPTNFFRDGQSFSLTAVDTTTLPLPTNVTRTFEIETGRVIENTFQGAVANYEGSTFTISDGTRTVIFEFDSNNAATTPAPTAPTHLARIAYDANTVTQAQMTQLIINAINNPAVTPAFTGPGTWGVRANLLPGTNRISLSGDTSLRLGNANAGALPESGAVRSPLTVSTITNNATGATLTDGMTFTIDSITFEFDNNNNRLTPGSTLISYTNSSNQQFVTQAINAAINTAGNALGIQSIFTTGSDTLRILGDSQITLRSGPLGALGALTATSDYGPTDASATTNILVPIEEYFTNLDDTRFAPTPSTPGAMDELILAIDNASVGDPRIDASNIGTRLVLTNATNADFSNMATAAFNPNTVTPGTIPVTFGFTDTAAVLNNSLLTQIQVFEPLAQLVAGNRIWLPARSSFVQATTNDRGDAPSRNAQLSVPQYGLVTGLAFAGTAMFGVSDQGDLYRIGGAAFNPDGTTNNGDFIETIYDTETGARVEFASLAAGPRNVESNTQYSTLDAGLDQILFGMSAQGRLYAFDTLGRPAHVFPDGNWFITTDATNVSGLAFSNLDVNLWHETTQRGGADNPGHGVNVSFDGSRRSQGNGGNSLYFGFENPNDASRQPGDWSGVNNPIGNFPGYDAARENSYDFPGGAKGSTISNSIDLSAYGPNDKPYLYFNYYLATENANDNNPTNNTFMRDAFRVFASDATGAWQLLATNNSQKDATRLSGTDDEFDTPFNLDPDNALNRQVQELYDVVDQGAPNGWRQARIELSRFAGQKDLRLRFDFSTAGSMTLGSTELISIPAVDIPVQAAQRRFTIDGTVFEFDFGLLMQIPSGGRITAGDNFTVNGQTFTFRNTAILPTDIPFSSTDSAETIAASIQVALLNFGFLAALDPADLSRVNVINATSASRSALLPANFIIDAPGVTPGTEPVVVSRVMDANEVRDAIRIALARVFNVAGQETNLTTWKFYDNIIYLWNRSVDNAGPLRIGNSPVSRNNSQGNEFGETPSGVTGQVGRGALRGQNNRFEGVYIDDITIGFAERGEMVTYTGNNASNLTDPTISTAFISNPQHEPAAGYTEIETGTYQIGVRRAATYGVGGAAFPSLGLVNTFDTNDRFAQGVSIVAPAGSELFDGQTFTLSDGVNTVTYEYDDTSITSGPRLGVAQGNIRVPFTAQDSPQVVARAIRDAINGQQSRATLDITAGLADGTATGALNAGKLSGSRVVHIHGIVSADRNGSSALPGVQHNSVSTATSHGFIIHGLEQFRFNTSGDQNRDRDQGQIILQGNTIRNSSGFGIAIDAGARVNGTLLPLAGNLPRPGSVRNLVQFNNESLVPGPVVVNNLIHDNGTGGILFSGDPRTATTVQAPTPFGRILNNTVVNSGVGIDVSQNASPTLLNNIVASNSTGIRVDATSLTTVIGATTYKSNTTDALPGNLGSNPQVLGANAPLFVRPGVFYLAEGSLAIDSSLEALNDRQAMTTVRQPLGIADSPIIAPDVDMNGQLRVDDPNSTPSGVGGNPFIDRGALDRADFSGPVAVIIRPQDNDSLNVDGDRNTTYIRLQEGNLDYFSILLQDFVGTGPDGSTINASSVVLTENGRVLVDKSDYTFGYNETSRTVRLTPLGGLWRNDSVYEITLINNSGHRVSVPSLAGLRDGDKLDIVVGSGPSAVTTTIEFDNNGSVANNSIPFSINGLSSPYQLAAQLYVRLSQLGFQSRLEGDGNLFVSGATTVTATTAQSNAVVVTAVDAIRDVAGNRLAPNRPTNLTQFTIVMPEAILDYGDSAGVRIPTIESATATNGNGSRHVILPVDYPLLALGSWVDANADGLPSAAADGDDSDVNVDFGTLGGVTQGTAGPARLQLPDASAIDGQTVSITDKVFPIVFEFDTDGITGTPGIDRIIITLNSTDTAQTVASALAAAVRQAMLDAKLAGVVPVASGNIVSLGGSASHRFELAAPSSVPMAQRIVRLKQGNVDMVIPTPLTTLADGQTMTITDSRGRTVTFELNTTVPVAVAPGNVSVNVDFSDLASATPTATPTSVAQAFISAINAQVAAGNLSLGGASLFGTSTVRILGDDEDGGVFDGLFNAGSPPVKTFITATDFGMLDVWIDWNGDGDFADASEKVFNTSILVRPGANELLIQTPATAVNGFTTARFRLSTLGGLLSTGVGIGGEVEDYLIEIAPGRPPVTVNDTYTVNEDLSPTVAPHVGVLANDTDADNLPAPGNLPGVNIFVHDENPTSTTIEPLTNVTNGTLVLNRDGTFTYTPFPDFNGVDSFTYRATDGRLLSAPAVVNITVAPRNDAPDANDDTLSILEDEVINIPGGIFTANDFAHFRMETGNPGFHNNESGQVLTLTGVQIISPAGGSASVVNNVLSYTPPAHYNNLIGGPVRLLLTISDDNTAGANGPLTATSTLTINIAELNDAPVFTVPEPVVNRPEDPNGTGIVTIPGFADDIASGPDTALDELGLPGLPAQTFAFQIFSNSNRNLFAKDANDQPILSIATDGTLNFQTAPDANGQAIIIARLRDNGLSTGGNVNVSLDRTFTINIAAVNDEPEFNISNPIVTSREDQGLVQVADFLTAIRPGPATAVDEAGQAVTVTVEALDPSKFTVTGQPSIGADGRLTFQTAPDVNMDNANLSVRVTLTDNGPSAAPNDNTVELIFTIQATPVNDAPSFAISNRNVRVNEDVVPYTEVMLNSMTTGPATATDEVNQSLTPRIISVSAPELFSQQPNIFRVGNTNTGELRFTPALHKNGSAIVVVRLEDGGSSTAPNVNASALQTFTITIDPINDAPDFTIPGEYNVLEDEGLKSVNEFAKSVRRGPVGADDENSQVLQFIVTPVDPSAFTPAGQPRIAVDGTLVFQVAENVNRLNAATDNRSLAVVVELRDDGAATPPNQNTSAKKTFTIKVDPVNDSPQSVDFITETAEDVPVNLLANNVLVNAVGGPTSDELNQLVFMEQVERTSLRGGTIEPVFDANQRIVSLRYTPPLNAVGFDSFVYVITDNGSPSMSGTATISVNINPRNDAPEFTIGGSQSSVEDAGGVTVNNWVTDILAGPADATDEHASQTVSFEVTVDNPALFSIRPTVDANGRLFYQTAPDANGSTIIRVVAVDSGSGVLPNVNRSLEQSATITVLPLNDAPVFTPGGNIAVLEDSGLHQSNWATNIRPAAGILATPQRALDEQSQLVDFTVFVDRPQLFSVQPVVSANGQISFTTAQDAFGEAVLTIRAVDRGPGGGLNVNTSDPVTITVSITGVNDRPIARNDNYVTDENTLLTVAASGLLSNDSDADVPNDSISAVAASIVSSLGAQVTINADGSFSYDPSGVLEIQRMSTGGFKIDTFTYTARDNALTLSDLAVVTLRVNGVNDAPIAVDDRFSIGVGQTRLLEVLANDTDVDSGIDGRTIQITRVPIFGSVVVNQTGVVQYVAEAGFRGTDTFAYVVRDALGALSNEASVSVVVNNAPVANPDVTFTYKNQSVVIPVLANDTDQDGTLDRTSIEIVVPPTPSGTATVNTDGTITFTPATNFAGEVTFSYVVSDNVGTTSNVAQTRVRVINSRWQNPGLNLDVNNDGRVTPLDPLVVISYLNNPNRPRNLVGSGFVPPPFVDVNGDERVTALDALLIIAYLNSRSRGGGGVGEGEGSAADGVNYAMMVTPQQMIDTVGASVVRDVERHLSQIREEVLAEATESIGAPEFACTPAHLDDALVAAISASNEHSAKSDDGKEEDEFFAELGPKFI